MDVRFRPLKSRPLRDRVSKTIKDAIFVGKLKPGEPLRELHLARDLQVSQTSIREALAQLEQEGLVVRTPNKGTVVTNLTRDEVRERLAMRVLLEGKAFVEAAARMGEEHYGKLAELAEAIFQAAARNAQFDLAQADFRFHHYVWEQCGNNTLVRILDQLTMPLFAFISILRRKGPTGLESTVRPHEQIIEALKTRDPDVIKETIGQHIETSPYDHFISSEVDDFQEFAESLV